ncbi:MAG: UPF0280 family protein [Alphaproteobacteria bacterium]
MNAAQAVILPDGRRLHFHHGPIDLIVEAFASPREIQAAYRQAYKRFATILQDLVDELPLLRQPCGTTTKRPNGTVARRMASAVHRHLPAFITPMAAVAGAVADEICAALCQGRDLQRAYVNNGGDTAFFLAPGQHLKAAIATGQDERLDDRATIHHRDPARGLATSGWRGRSWSFGIADAVTVTAATSAAADVAATLIANAVDLPGHPAIHRAPANSHDPDSDLGDRLITIAVGPLAQFEIQSALDAGMALASTMASKGLIQGAALFLAGESTALDPADPHSKELCNV